MASASLSSSKPRTLMPSSDLNYLLKADFFRVLGHPARVRSSTPPRQRAIRRRTPGSADARLKQHLPTARSPETAPPAR